MRERRTKRLPWRARALALTLSVALSACGSSRDDADPVDDQDERPTPPTNLSGVVFTDTEIRLLWEPTTDDGRVVGYDLERDGEPLVDALDALAYTDDTVLPATTYRYSVVAIDDQGNRSETATLTLSTPERSPILDQGNYVAVIAGLFDAYRGAIYDPLVLRSAAYYRYNDPVSTEYEYLDSGHVYRAFHEFECTNGGTASVVVVPYLASDREVETLFDDCAWDGFVLDGRVRWFWPPQSDSQSVYRFAELVIDGPRNRQITVDGSIGIDSVVIGGTEHRGDYALWTANLARYENTGESAETRVTEADTLFGYGRDRVGNANADLSGALSLSSVATGNRSVDVTVPVPFRNVTSSDREFAIGEMRIDAGDGSAIRLSTDSDDPSTLILSLTIDGATQTFDAAWADWAPQLTFEAAQ